MLVSFLLTIFTEVPVIFFKNTHIYRQTLKTKSRTTCLYWYIQWIPFPIFFIDIHHTCRCYRSITYAELSTVLEAND